MAASYPSNLKSFGTKTDFVDTVIADHVNSLQEETVAVQTALGTSPTVSSGWIGTFDSTTTSWVNVKTRINNLEYGVKNVFDRVGNATTTGSGALVFGTSPTIATPLLTLSSTTSTSAGRLAWDNTAFQLDVGDGSTIRTITADNAAATLTNKTFNLTSNTFVATSAQLASAVTDETGSGALVFGTGPTITPAAGTTATATDGAGYMGMPQNSTGTGITLAATDAGKHVYVTTTGQTLTIPSNVAVAFPIGTTIVVVNANNVSTTIAITSDTLRLANSASTGSRTLASNGMCTLLKIASTTWIASGNGLT